MNEPLQVEQVEKLLQTVLDEILEGFQVIDRGWRYLYVNEVVARQGKRTKEELVGKTMMECYPGIENTPLFTTLKNCMNDGTSATLENEFSYPDGSKGWFMLYIHPWDDGVMIFSVDITDKKKAEHELFAKIEELNNLKDLVAGRQADVEQLQQAIGRLYELIPENDNLSALQ